MRIIYTRAGIVRRTSSQASIRQVKTSASIKQYLEIAGFITLFVSIYILGCMI